MYLSLKMITRDICHVSPFVFCLFYLFSPLAHASVSLDKTWKLEGDTSISGMVEMQDDVIIIADHNKGVLRQLADDVVKEISLTKNGEVFESSGVNGMEAAADDLLAVSSESDNRFALISRHGELVVRMGESGSGAGMIDEPQGIAYSANRRIYVADKANDRVAIFGADGVFLENIGADKLIESERVEQPVQVYVDKLERVYVLEGVERGRLAIFNYQGKLIKRFSHAVLEKIMGENARYTAMSLDKRGLVYLADSENGRVFQLDWQQGKKIGAFGSKGRERGRFEK